MLQEATIDEYLSMAVISLSAIEENKEVLLNELNSGKIFYFVFNYRSDYEGDDAFLICNEVFAVTGMIAEINFIGLEDNEKELISQENERTR